MVNWDAFEFGNDRLGALGIGRILDPHFRIRFTKRNITQTTLSVLPEHTRVDTGMAQQSRDEMCLRQVSGLVNADQVILGVLGSAELLLRWQHDDKRCAAEFTIGKRDVALM